MSFKEKETKRASDNLSNDGFIKKKSERLDDYVILTDRHIEDNCFGLSHLYEE